MLSCGREGNHTNLSSILSALFHNESFADSAHRHKPEQQQQSHTCTHRLTLDWPCAWLPPNNARKNKQKSTYFHIFSENQALAYRTYGGKHLNTVYHQTTLKYPINKRKSCHLMVRSMLPIHTWQT